MLIFGGYWFLNTDHHQYLEIILAGKIMYIDYFPIEAVESSATFDADVVDIRRAKRLTPISDLLPHDASLHKLRPRCFLHKGSFDGNHAYCKHCGATYCLPCARQLIELNEPCWLCGLPLALKLIITVVPQSAEE